MDNHGLGYLLMAIIGPALLIIAIAWAILHNRGLRRRREDTERATRNLYEEVDRADQAGKGKTS
jgi:hypothetical protein